MGAFSIGFPFDYWHEYGAIENSWNKDEARNEFYIKPKYGNFKEEIRNYQFIDFRKQYENEVFIKASKYMETLAVRSILCAPPADFWSIGIKYGVSHGSRITIQHIISVMLYTDYTDLSASFTSSFRKHEAFETFNRTKSRNRRYWWWSKFLMETVQIYGETGNAVCSRDERYSYHGRGPIMPGRGSRLIEKGTLKGPFFCGMSRTMIMPQFQISLLSPTSTSCHIEVAMKFSGESGIIIQFDNERQPAQHVKGFDVSSFSRYKEEDER